MLVGYLGPKHSFTYQATKLLYREQKKIPYVSIPLVIEALITAEIDYAIVPIENSLEGSVHTSIDKLFQTTLLDVKEELVLPIRQQFMMHHGQFSPTKIFSHPQALAQSQAFLMANYPNVPLVAMDSTTAAAEYVSLNSEECVAAIGPVKAAQAFGLEIIHKNIQDNENNQTRFWVLTKKKQKEAAQPAKMTLFCSLPSNQAGALHKLLAAFAWREIDLTKIESRPLKTSLGHYYFIVDLVVTNNLELIYYAMDEIKKMGTTITFLGPYPVKQVD